MQTIDLSLATTDLVPYLSTNGVEVFVVRFDKIHPVITGNKWFKIKYYLQEAKEQNKKRIVTFGGAYSNLIIAAAEACKIEGIESAAIVRGEEPTYKSHTLQQAMERGMKLYFVSRADYKQKKIPSNLINEENYFVPEGGFGPLGAAGAATTPYDKNRFDYVCCAVGTGVWMAGLINGKANRAEVVGISVLKNNFELENLVSSLLINKNEPVTIFHNYHFGKYAKYSQQLIDFMNEFYRQTLIPTDFVYSAKLFYAVQDLIQQGYFKKGSRIVIPHCGGLQGNESLGKGTLIF